MEIEQMETAAMEPLIRRAAREYLWARQVRFADLPRKTEELTRKMMEKLYGSR
jgi:hypothetical protein